MSRSWNARACGLDLRIVETEDPSSGETITRVYDLGTEHRDLPIVAVMWEDGPRLTASYAHLNRVELAAAVAG